MLEIASEIIVCLLLAALIGFAIGYLIGKSQSSKTKPETKSETVPFESNEKEEDEPQEEIPDVLVPEEEIEVKDEAQEAEEVDIPTGHLVEQALEALENFEEIDKEQKEEVAEVEEKDQKPELLSAAREEGKDNLTLIKGIGPKVEEKLNASGIYYFEQIAHWTEENMLWLEAHTLFASRVKKEAWKAEAKALLTS